jgi:hypothetical protein
MDIIINVSALVNPELFAGDFNVAGNCTIVTYEPKRITEFYNLNCSP